jgi:ribonuclease BN (tRNA processing enzyme)
MRLTGGVPKPAQDDIFINSMKIQLLPSTFDENGRASARQHLSCLIIDDLVAFDAGSLAMSVNETQRKQVRDIVLTHAHLDHIAGLPLFIDDLFASLEKPIRIHASPEVIEILERDIFNWSVYPRFSELQNSFGAVIDYCPFELEKEFAVRHLRVKAVSVNHKVPSVGFVISDKKNTVAMSGDTAEIGRFWEFVNREKNLSAILVECAFPNELNDLATISYHMTPQTLKQELQKLAFDCPVYLINIKPMYFEQVIRQIADLQIENLKVLEVGKIFEF